MTSGSRPTAEEIEADDNNRTTAVGLYHYAESYRDSADMLEAHPPEGLIFADPIRFLYFHAIELYLKAFLRSEGISVRALKQHPYGHDLAALHQACAERGLRLPEDAAAVFGFISAVDPMEARYIRTGATTRYEPEALRKFTGTIREAVANHLKERNFAIRWRNVSDVREQQ